MTSEWNVKTFYKPHDSAKYEIHVLNSECLNSLEVLKVRIEYIYPALNGKSFFLSVIDDEGDPIQIRNGDEFHYFFFYLCKKFRTTQKTFKIYVEEEEKGREVGYDPATHEGVVCDECNSQIQGFRYKCLECFDYDLCEKCEGLHHHSHHLMVRLGTPCLCSVVLKKARDNCKSFLLSVENSNGDEGHCDCRRRKGKCKHRRHSGRCSEKRENDGEGDDRKCMKRFKRANCNFPDYMDMFNNFIRKYDKFINPSLTTHEDIGEREASFITNCSEILADLTSAYCNSMLDRNGGVPCRGNSSAETVNEKEGRKGDSEGSAGAPESENEGAAKSENDGAPRSENDGAPKEENEGAPKRENDGAEAADSVSTNLEDILKRFSSQTISDKKESVAVAEEEIPSTADAHSQPKSDKQDSSEKKIGNYMGHELSLNVMLSLMEMISMGFSTEDERIIPLLIEKKGDISQVIDALYKN